MVDTCIKGVHKTPHEKTGKKFVSIYEQKTTIFLKTVIY